MQDVDAHVVPGWGEGQRRLAGRDGLLQHGARLAVSRSVACPPSQGTQGGRPVNRTDEALRIVYGSDGHDLAAVLGHVDQELRILRPLE